MVMSGSNGKVSRVIRNAYARDRHVSNSEVQEVMRRQGRDKGNDYKKRRLRDKENM